MLLTLKIEGDGNLDLFETPRLDLEGFHVQGAVDDKRWGRRTITYHLVPFEKTLTEVPAIPFSFFDPRAKAYGTALTEAIPIEVIGGTEPAPSEAETSGSLLWIWIGAAALACFVVWLGLRKRKSVPGPAEVFRDRAQSDLADAFTEYLAARLHCPAASVIAPDLPARLTAAGVRTELAIGAATLLERLVARRYGGASSGNPLAEAHKVVEALEATFR